MSDKKTDSKADLLGETPPSAHDEADPYAENSKVTGPYSQNPYAANPYANNGSASIEGNNVRQRSWKTEHHTPPDLNSKKMSSTSRISRGSKKEKDLVTENQLVLHGEQQRSPGRLERRRKDDDDDDTFGSIFTTSRPNHVGSGLLSGAWNVTKGVLLGAGTLVAAPAYGAYKEGPKGFATGLGKGVAAAVALPVAGVVTGAMQVGYGAWNTPAYVKETNKGKVWDENKKTWVDKYTPVDEEFSEAKAAYDLYVLERKEKSNSKQKNSTVSTTSTGEKKVADTEYYEILQVPVEASQAEVRKAYYKLAKECHPDKKKDDPDAHSKFQAVGEAYQVLGDQARREQYDKHGKSATEQMAFMDSSIFFAMLFGSEPLEPFIGQLKLASMVEADEDDEVSLVQPDEREETYRHCNLAVKLRDRLEAGVEAYRRLAENPNDKSVEEWSRVQRFVADTLCAESFGAPLVDAVGFVYENYADQFIGKKETFLQYGGTVAKFQHQKRQVGTIWSALQAAKKANKTQKKAQKKVQAKQNAEAGAPGSPEPTSSSEEFTAEDAEAMDKPLKHIMETMLQLCIADINGAVRAAAKKVLNDPSVHETEQRYRAQALQKLGKIFQAAAKVYLENAAPINARDHFQDAFIRMTQKMDEQKTP